MSDGKVFRRKFDEAFMALWLASDLVKSTHAMQLPTATVALSQSCQRLVFSSAEYTDWARELIKTHYSLLAVLLLMVVSCPTAHDCNTWLLQIDGCLPITLMYSMSAGPDADLQV